MGAQGSRLSRPPSSSPSPPSSSIDDDNNEAISGPSPSTSSTTIQGSSPQQQPQNPSANTSSQSSTHAHPSTHERSRNDDISRNDDNLDAALSVMGSIFLSKMAAPNDDKNSNAVSSASSSTVMEDVRQRVLDSHRNGRVARTDSVAVAGAIDAVVAADDAVAGAVAADATEDPGDDERKKSIHDSKKRGSGNVDGGGNFDGGGGNCTGSSGGSNGDDSNRNGTLHERNTRGNGDGESIPEEEAPFPSEDSEVYRRIYSAVLSQRDAFFNSDGDGDGNGDGDGEIITEEEAPFPSKDSEVFRRIYSAVLSQRDAFFVGEEYAQRRSEEREVECEQLPISDDGGGNSGGGGSVGGGGSHSNDNSKSAITPIPEINTPLRRYPNTANMASSSAAIASSAWAYPLLLTTATHHIPSPYVRNALLPTAIWAVSAHGPLYDTARWGMATSIPSMQSLMDGSMRRNVIWVLKDEGWRDWAKEGVMGSEYVQQVDHRSRAADHAGADSGVKKQ